MAYSESRKTLAKVRPYLADLEKGVGTKWTLQEHGSARHFAYKIREGLYIGSLYPEEFPELALAHATFRIEIVGRQIVQAVFKNRTLDGSVAGTVTVHGLEGAERGPTTLAGEQTAASMIGAWHNAQPSNTPMTFPQANLNREELEKLHRWAEARTPRWLLMVADGGRITLTPYTRDLDGLGWDPTDE